MLIIAKLQLLSSIRDLKYIVIGLLILLAFLLNGITFSKEYESEKKDYQSHLAATNETLRGLSSNLQDIAVLNQEFRKPPSPLSFIAEAGQEDMPNIVAVNAFNRYETGSKRRKNEMLPRIYSLDWVFIIGFLMSFLAVAISYDAISGEKKQGTLKLVLSNSLSRISFFIGKYLGIMFSMAILLFLGFLLNITAISLAGQISLKGELLSHLAWAVLLSLLYMSFFLVAGLAISSLTQKPSVSLVVLLIVWVVLLFIIPGTTRLLSEKLVKVPSRASVILEQEKAQQEIWESREKYAGVWNDDPFDKYIPQRARLALKRSGSFRKIEDSYIEKQKKQLSMSRLLSSLSPYGLLNDGLQTLSETGSAGLSRLLEKAESYRQALHSYVVYRDKLDPDTPHLVYGYQLSYDRGVFSSKGVEYDTIPKMDSVWNESGMSDSNQVPLLHLILLLSFNAFAALVAILAIAYYDPR